ncbi:Protein strawberry notch-like [Tropilaelaps mercedesae]|uniref:Protein strawberry notch-like n=1 Tax=Tropilaelaps mercedesae TaxID=418985 RepID=A0A1V9X706_9ACAR|nr:Protein strawberry notch-like [Tropilaelaps mercedesae]
MDLLSAALDESGIGVEELQAATGPSQLQPPPQHTTPIRVQQSVPIASIPRVVRAPAKVLTTPAGSGQLNSGTAVYSRAQPQPGQQQSVKIVLNSQHGGQQVVQQLSPGTRIVRIARQSTPLGTSRPPTIIKMAASPGTATTPTNGPRGPLRVVRVPASQLSQMTSSSGAQQIRLVSTSSGGQQRVVIRSAAPRKLTPVTLASNHVVRVASPKMVTRVMTPKGPAVVQTLRPAQPHGSPRVVQTTTHPQTTTGATRIIHTQSPSGGTIIRRVVAVGAQPSAIGGQATPITTHTISRPAVPLGQVVHKVAASSTTTPLASLVRKVNVNGHSSSAVSTPRATSLVSRSVPHPRSLLVTSRGLAPANASSQMRVQMTSGSALEALRNGDGARQGPAPATRQPQQVIDEAQIVAEEEDELGVAETYSDYVPAKLRIGMKHPDPVVETASLSSVPPPDVHYRLSVDEETVDTGALSALQLESITYACQQHEVILPNGQRAGYLIGDGPGIGKGRTVAGIIFENFLLGRRRALWLSIDVHPLNKFKYHKITSKRNGSCKKGVIFATYSSLIGESSSSSSKYRTRLKQLLHWCGGEDFDGVIVFDECHKAKNLYPAGSSKPTKTGQTVLELQNRLPKARVVYASATGASEPRNMAYMTRLGIWGEGTQFSEFNDFLNAVEKRGVGTMELVAMDMKLRGMYIARQLSFAGVTFRIEEVALGDRFVSTYNKAVRLWIEARRMFAEAAQLMDADARVKKTMWGQFWGAHQRFFKYLCIAAKVPYVVKVARDAIRDGKCVVIGLQSTGESRTLEQLEEQGGELTDFVSTARGVFQSLVEKHFPAPNRRKTLALLGLGDGEASMSASDDDLSGDDFNPFGSDNGDGEADDPWASRGSSRKRKATEEKKPKKAKKEKKERMKESKEEKDKRRKDRSPSPFSEMTQSIIFSKDAGDKAAAMKQQLLAMLDSIGDVLPINTLDQLIDELGGPSEVAEMTGRKGRVVSDDNGGVSYESRTESDVPLEILNVTEKQRFMSGEKNIAIISEAASSGISLQADRRADNRKRRLHITLELPWSADRAVQQFGRTHRSNQVSAPEYLFLISDLAGERRFASIVAKRIESMGALTHGDRRAGESRDLSMFNIDNNFGRIALEHTMKAIMGHEKPMVKPPEEYDGDFFADCKEGLLGVGLVVKDDGPSSIAVLDKDYNNISKFLNRLLGLKVDLQNSLFKYFMDTMEAVVSSAKREGKFDLGILDLGANADNVKLERTEEYVRSSPTGPTTTELHTVSVERGMSWEEAIDKYRELYENDEGFYLSNQVRNGHKTVILAVYAGKSNKNSKSKSREKLFRTYRPNTGLQVKQETLANIKAKYKFVSPDDAQDSWESQYTSSEHTCSHAYWTGVCRKAGIGIPCDAGLRSRTYHVLAGSVFTVWSKVESALSANNMVSFKLQVVRLKTESGLRIVGTMVPSTCVQSLRTVLTEDAQRTSIKQLKKEPKVEEIAD